MNTLKLIMLISLSAIAGMVYQYYQPFIDPEVITIDNWQTIDAKRMVSKNDCEQEKYRIMYNFDKDLKTFLLNHGIEYKTWQGIIESNTNF